MDAELEESLVDTLKGQRHQRDEMRPRNMESYVLMLFAAKDCIARDAGPVPCSLLVTGADKTVALIHLSNYPLRARGSLAMKGFRQRERRVQALTVHRHRRSAPGQFHSR